MKKPALLICILLLVSAVTVSASVSPYMSSQVGVRPMERPAPANCWMDVTVSPGDIRFTSKARQECIGHNRGNYICQNKCFEQVTMILRRGAAAPMRAESRYGCNAVDNALLTGVEFSTCYFSASVECAKANPGDWCRKKCVRDLYRVCRQRIIAPRGRVS